MINAIYGDFNKNHFMIENAKTTFASKVWKILVSCIYF